MQINANQRNGNLHIKLNGPFTSDTAARLTMVMAKTYPGKGNIFIHTDNISAVSPESQGAFNDLVNLSALPEDKIYLMGEKGLDICHDSGKVIVRKNDRAIFVVANVKIVAAIRIKAVNINSTKHREL